jgi:hypothetical protein
VVEAQAVSHTFRKKTADAATAAGVIAVFTHQGDFGLVVESIATWVKCALTVADAAAGAVGTDAIVTVVGGIVVAVYNVVINTAVMVIVAVAGDLHWLWLCYQGGVRLIYIRDVGFFFCLVAISFGFSGFRWFSRSDIQVAQWRVTKAETA